jgi:hypothetical protein
MPVVISSALTSTTPGRLRIASAALVVLGLAAGVLGYFTFTSRAADLRAAQADTNQPVRLQQIRTDLVAADAIATNAFLVGGLGPDGARAQYLARITTPVPCWCRCVRRRPSTTDRFSPRPTHR